MLPAGVQAGRWARGRSTMHGGPVISVIIMHWFTVTVVTFESCQYCRWTEPSFSMFELDGILSSLSIWFNAECCAT